RHLFLSLAGGKLCFYAEDAADGIGRVEGLDTNNYIARAEVNSALFCFILDSYLHRNDKDSILAYDVSVCHFALDAESY
ncbi:MAG: hypothetical protein KBI19_07545, partial [Candidatus Cloacimonas sp.]|nr:hypothetical protein [Candidatus Cloacimonas sp.]